MNAVLSWILVCAVGAGLFAWAVIFTEWVDRTITRHRERYARWSRDEEDLRRREALNAWGRAQHPMRSRPYDWRERGDFE